jgi:HSP20 family molecular chaperone IbpA
MQTNPFKHFQGLLSDAEAELSRAWPRWDGHSGTAALDVVEWDGEFVMTCDSPGFEAENPLHRERQRAESAAAHRISIS